MGNSFEDLDLDRLRRRMQLPLLAPPPPQLAQVQILKSVTHAESLWSDDRAALARGAELA